MSYAPGYFESYDIRIHDDTRAKIAKFAGTRTLEFKLGFRCLEPQPELLPVLVSIDRYATLSKDADGTSLAYDTTQKPDEDFASFQETAVELCQNVYPLGIESTSSLVQLPGYSTSTSNSLTAADQFGTDLKLALTTLLVPIDGMKLEQPHTWKVQEDWEELRDAVPLVIEHQLTKVEKPENPQSNQAASSIALVTLRGGGKQVQEGSPAYTATISLQGEYRVQLIKGHPRGGSLIDLTLTETMTTDDVFDSSRTRTITIRRLDVSDRKQSAKEAEIVKGQNWEPSRYHTRTVEDPDRKDAE